TSALSSSVHTATVGVSQVIKTTMSNEVRVNYSSQSTAIDYAADQFGEASPLPADLFYPSGFSSSNSLFEMIVGGAGEFAQGHAATDEQRQVNLVDTLSAIKGSHQLKFGVDYRWLAPVANPYSYQQFAFFSGMSATPGGALSGTALFAQTITLQSNSL